MKRKIIVIGSGLILATILVWLVGMVFLESPIIYQYDPSLQLIIPTNGTFKQTRSENWQYHRYGKLGLETRDAAKLDIPEPKTLIFGDSYIEANMVAGEDRMQNYLIKPAIGIGFSGFDFQDYLQVIPHYLQTIGNVKNIIIFIGDINDLTVSENTPKVNFQTISNPIDKVSYDTRIYAFRAIIRKWRQAQLDFIGNASFRQHDSETRTSSNCDDLGQYFTTCLRQLKSIGPYHFLIVYAPIIPKIEGNSIIFQDKNKEIMERFGEICRNNDVGYINLEADFIEYFKQTGKFPRGFFNTPIGEGHLNREGHRIAGVRIQKFLEAK